MMLLVGYFFAIVLLAWLLWLWEWRHAFIWHIAPVSPNQTPVQRKITLLRNRLSGVFGTLQHILHHVLTNRHLDERRLSSQTAEDDSRNSTVTDKERFSNEANPLATESSLARTHDVAAHGSLTYIVLAITLAAFIWLPISESMVVVTSAYSAVILLAVVLCVLVMRILFTSGFSLKKQTYYAVLPLWLVMKGVLVLILAVIGVGVSIQSYDMYEVVLQDRLSITLGTQILGAIAFMLVSMVLLHQHRPLIRYGEWLKRCSESNSDVTSKMLTDKSEGETDVDSDTQIEDKENTDAEVRSDSVAHARRLNDDIKGQDSSIGQAKVQPLLGAFSSGSIVTLWIDYLLLIMLCGMVVTLYLGAWLPWFGIQGLLPETWFVIKLCLVLVIMLQLRRWLPPFFQTHIVYQHWPHHEGAISQENIEAEPRYVVDYHRTHRVIWRIAMPLVCLNLLIQWVML